MPILKQLVSSSQSKRRSRADLTHEMISAPLGDFRHTMHVGRGGDTFGDTSFLSTRSGEPPRQPPEGHHHPPHHHPPQQPPPPPPESPSHKPGLLSRTFRSSKRSQSYNRADKQKPCSASALTVSAAMPGSPAHVKTAISLPYLNEAGAGGMGGSMPKSVSSSPLKTLAGGDGDGDVLDGRKPANGAAAAAAVTLAAQEPDLLERERRFGELSDLPPSLPRGGGGGFGGMKHAESIMSFHIDLGPSMLGDILSVMDKRGWEEDDLGYEEGRTSPPLSPPEDNGNDDDDDDAPSPPPPSRPPRSSVNPELRGGGGGGGGGGRPPIIINNNNNHHHHMDSCSVSSSGSTVQEDKMSIHGGHQQHNQSETDVDSARFSSPGRTRDDEKDFSFMDDEDDEDEIRV